MVDDNKKEELSACCGVGEESKNEESEEAKSSLLVTSRRQKEEIWRPREGDRNSAESFPRSLLSPYICVYDAVYKSKNRVIQCHQVQVTNFLEKTTSVYLFSCTERAGNNYDR